MKQKDYLELDVDQMVDCLTDFQKLSREMMRTAKIVPYSMTAHRDAVGALFEKAKWLADQGDVV